MNGHESLTDSIDLTPRRSVWLDKTSRDSIVSAITSLLNDDDTDVTPEHDYLLQQVLSEMSVVEARGAYYLDIDRRVRLEEGQDPTSEPVRLSDEEIKAIAGLPHLPDSLRSLLYQQRSEVQENGDD